MPLPPEMTASLGPTPTRPGAAVSGLTPDVLSAGLTNLTPEEVQRLDVLITPELSALLGKAFPEIAEVLAPLAQPGPGQAPGPAPAGPGPGPAPLVNGGPTPGAPAVRPSTPLGRIG